MSSVRRYLFLEKSAYVIFISHKFKNIAWNWNCVGCITNILKQFQSTKSFEVVQTTAHTHARTETQGSRLKIQGDQTINLNIDYIHVQQLNRNNVLYSEKYRRFFFVSHFNLFSIRLLRIMNYSSVQWVGQFGIKCDTEKKRWQISPFEKVPHKCINCYDVASLLDTDSSGAFNWINWHAPFGRCLSDGLCP